MNKNYENMFTDKVLIKKSNIYNTYKDDMEKIDDILSNYHDAEVEYDEIEGIIEEIYDETEGLEIDPTNIYDLAIAMKYYIESQKKMYDIESGIAYEFNYESYFELEDELTEYVSTDSIIDIFYDYIVDTEADEAVIFLLSYNYDELKQIRNSMIEVLAETLPGENLDSSQIILMDYLSFSFDKNKDLLINEYYRNDYNDIIISLIRFTEYAIKLDNQINNLKEYYKTITSNFNEVELVNFTKDYKNVSAEIESNDYLSILID